MPTVDLQAGLRAGGSNHYRLVRHPLDKIFEVVVTALLSCLQSVTLTHIPGPDLDTQTPILASTPKTDFAGYPFEDPSLAWKP